MAKPFVTINLDKPRKLRYGMNQLIQLEETLGVSVSELNKVSMGLKELRVFLWAGLSWEDPDLTLEKAGELADEAEDITYVAEKIGEALAASFGGEEKKKKGPAAKSGTGKKS